MRSFGIFCQKEGGSHPICRDVIGDIIHYFTFMSSKLTLFALFSIFRHYSLFFQKYENNVITLYTFQNFRLFSTISAGEIGSQGSWPLASCSQLRASSRERWAVCPSRPYLYGRARICVVQAQRVIELFGKKVNNALNVHKITKRRPKLKKIPYFRPYNARIFAKNVPVFLQKWARRKNWAHWISSQGSFRQRFSRLQQC